MGARLISVSGLLQNEKDVIHIVAERFDDLTPLLSRLSEHASGIDTTSRADHAKNSGPPDSRGHPRRGDSLVQLLRRAPERADELLSTQDVLPKGRNFH
jgi:error-prone DNA polymerase